MGPADFAGAGRIATADQSDGRGRMVRLAEGAQAKFFRLEMAEQREHGGGGFGGGAIQRRHQAGQARCEHGFSRAGRADHQERMLPCGGNFQGPFGLRLAAYFTEVGEKWRFFQVDRSSRWQGVLVAQMGANIE
jgi:hypothetical protein